MKSQEGRNLEASSLPNNFSEPIQRDKKVPKRFLLWNMISLLLFFAMFANTVFCSLLLYHYSFSNQETQMLLRSLLTKLQQQSFQDNMVIDNFKAVEKEPPFHVNSFEHDKELSFKKFDRLMGSPAITEAPIAECRCPTCAPTIEVPTNKDSVSLVNAKYREKATYDCIMVCTVPPIHVATLTIKGKPGPWEGRARSRQLAKHDAAYKALLKVDEDLAQVAEEAGYEQEFYNPTCNGLFDIFPMSQMQRIPKEKC